MVTPQERFDPLCRWMIHACTLENGIQYRKLRAGNGQYEWNIFEISSSFHSSAAEQHNLLPEDDDLRNEVEQCFTDYAYYLSRGYFNRKSNPRPMTGRNRGDDTGRNPDSHQISMQ